MSDTATAIWVIVIFIIALNGAAAGVVAAFHAWQSRMRRGQRIVAAATASGVLSGAWLIPFALSAESTNSEEPMIIVLVFVAFIGVGTLVSLPGALIVGRKLDSPGDIHRAFE
jgi:cytochrome bd-type quinol oxidase subunit 2